MEPSETVLSFGYGSNLCLDRLEHRLGGPGTADPIAVGYLANYALRFNKRSQSDRDPQPSGKGNALCTGEPGDRVWGVVFRIKLRDLPGLDVAEGLGQGYERQSRPIHAGGETILDALVYLATDVDDTVIPYDWYKRLVVDGLGSWPGIPPEYTQHVADTTPQRLDPDAARERRERAWRCTARALAGVAPHPAAR